MLDKLGSILACTMHNKLVALQLIRKMKTDYLLRHWDIHTDQTKKEVCTGVWMAEKHFSKYCISMKTQVLCRLPSIQTIQTSSSQIYGQLVKVHGKMVHGMEKKAACLNQRMAALHGKNLPKGCQQQPKTGWEELVLQLLQAIQNECMQP